MSTVRRARARPPGFTLVELAIVLFIVGMLVAGLVGPVQVQLEARDRRSTQSELDAVVEALYGFALTNRRLPCPDTDGDGIANPVYAGTLASATCTSDEGFVPWAELGVGRGDAWGNRLRYRVTSPDWTWPSQDTVCNGATQNEFDLCTTGTIQVNSRGDNPGTAGAEGKFLLAPAIVTANVAAVVLSHGRNGYGATSVEGDARPAPPAANADETENTDGDTTYFMRRYATEQGGCADDANEATPLCEFDDLVVPVSRTILNSRMVVAGQLP